MDKGYYKTRAKLAALKLDASQSTIKMDKGYYLLEKVVNQKDAMSQSTIKMDKGYYKR